MRKEATVESPTVVSYSYCFIFCIAAIGAAIGAVVNAVAYTVQVASTGQPVDAGGLLGAMASGAVAGAVTAASFVVEPIDYAMTAVQCVTDGCSLAEVALTVVPGAIGPVAKQIDNVLDVARATSNIIVHACISHVPTLAYSMMLADDLSAPMTDQLQPYTLV